MSMGPRDAAAPAFHARRAAELAPVTVPVVRAAALVLARSGDPDSAVRLVREMFSYDAENAARVLTTLEPFLGPTMAGRAIPADPDAWLRWALELRERDRQEEADDWLRRAHREWPAHPGVRQAAAARLVQQRDWESLAAMFPPDEELPDSRENALLFAFRARARAEGGDRAGALSDAAKAVELSGSSITVLLHAGDALLSAGDPEGARRLWSRALFAIPPRSDAGSERVRLLVRMARYEDEHGKPAESLRAWKAVLEEESHHPEARRRIADLGGALAP
jgi:tetratricopeptide (TPR) repeat protein